jgi:hypothetical protein
MLAPVFNEGKKEIIGRYRYREGLVSDQWQQIVSSREHGKYALDSSLMNANYSAYAKS